MELKNYNPKCSEDWAMVAKYDSVEIDGTVENKYDCVVYEDEEEINTVELDNYGMD